MTRATPILLHHSACRGTCTRPVAALAGAGTGSVLVGYASARAVVNAVADPEGDPSRVAGLPVQASASTSEISAWISGAGANWHLVLSGFGRVFGEPTAAPACG